MIDADLIDIMFNIDTNYYINPNTKISFEKRID